MKIKQFSFKRHRSGWNVQNVTFGPLTLLVGASGVGKTQILKAISALTRIASGHSFNGVEWAVLFEEDGCEYNWSGRFELIESIAIDLIWDDNDYAIVEEKLVAGQDVIFSRTGEQLLYHGVPTVKLDAAKSAVELLKEESDVAPVNRGFKKINWLDMGEGSRFAIRPGLLSKDKQDMTLAEIKQAKYLTAIDRLFLIKKHHRQLFEAIFEAFHAIFPLVDEIDFDLDTWFKPDDAMPVLKIRESGIDTWIKFPNISAGMCRTLSQIVALSLADDGDVILIDEFENGLGINCIDSLADMAMEPDVNVQLIMTSHHPYIINNIPFGDWLIVSRKGSDVRVNTAAELKIGEFSKHDAFMQLIQTSAYRTGRS